MGNILFKKILAGILIVTMLPIGFFFQPKETKAFVVTDPTNLVQNTISALSNVAKQVIAQSEKWKEFVGDGLMRALASQMTRQLTTSIVNWINSGFQGSPSFIQNPGAFFMDVADQTTGEFLATKGGPLNELCSPFSIDLRLALAFKYHPKAQKRYACTLGTIINNYKGAIKNASINGFTAGDFRQGGWPAFVSLTTEPQNNIYGAYLTADSELSFRVANAQSRQREQLNQGRGFLSWKDPDCVKLARDSHTGKVETIYDDVLGKVMVNTGGNTYKPVTPESECPIQTPGSVIAGALDLQLGTGLRQSELADEINEIVNALFAQLITQVLSKGLGSASGKGPGDPNAYINQISNDIKTDPTQLKSIRDSILQNIDTYIKDTITYKANREQAFSLIQDVKNTYDSAKTCYNTKITSSNPPLTATQKNYAETQINQIDSKLITNIAPIYTRLSTGLQEANTRLSTLQDIKVQANSAQSIDEINIPAQQYGVLIQNEGLTNAKDVVDSQTDLEKVADDVKPLKQDAVQQINQCQAFPVGVI